MSACAASSCATIASACRRSSRPASVRSTRPRAAGAVDEPLPDVALELRDLLADGGLGVAELAGRPAEGARAADGLEGREMPQLDAEQSITFHNQYES